MAKLTLTDIAAGYNVATVYNDNNDLVVAALENTLSRDGTSPNDMSAELDMGSYRIINLGAPTNDNDAVRYIDVANIMAGGDVTISPTVAWTGITGMPATVDDIGDLTDPGADRLLFWDDSAGELVYLTAGTGLTIAGTTISSTVSSVAWSGITSVPAYVTSLGLLTDPGADRIVFWDDSASNLAHLTVGTGLNLTTTTLSLDHLGLEDLTDPAADRILFWDDSAGIATWLTVGAGLSITGTTLSVGSSTGSFTGTLTGVTGTVTGTIKYSKTGNTVVLDIPDITGTSNSTAHTLTGAPSDLFPTTAQTSIGVTTNNSVDAFGKVVVETTGVITLYNVFSATFAGTGTEGIKAGTLSYLTN